MPSPRNKKLSPRGRKRHRADRPKPRKAHGRPCTYNAKIHDLAAYTIALSEGTHEILAERIEINISHLYVWFKKYPTFAEAWKKGKQLIHDDTFDSFHKRVKGFIAIDVKEKVDINGNVSTETTKRTIIPDTTAILASLARIDRSKGMNIVAAHEVINSIMQLDPYNKVNVDNTIPPQNNMS